MLSIDEAIAREREKAKEIRENIIDEKNLEPYESYCIAMAAKCAEEHEQLAEWLEELKAYQQQHLELCEKYGVNTIEDLYDKAIDDFIRKCEMESRVILDEIIHLSYYGLSMRELQRIAEQLKAGGKNEQS